MFSTISVSFPNSANQPGRVASYTIRQSRYEHDLITVVFKDWNTREAIVKAGSPMAVTLTNGEVNSTFYGYVHHFSRKRRADADYVEVTGIGASFVMKQASQNVYVNTTASEVAKKIAKKHRFSYNIAPHPRVYPQISQAGLTDWQLLAKLAKQCGYTLRADNAVLHFKPVIEEYEYDRILAPKFFMTSMGMPVKPTIYSFNPMVGDILSYEDAQKAAVAVSGMDPRSGVAYAITSKKRGNLRARPQPEIFDRFNTSTVTMDYLTAKYESEAVTELNRFPYRATAVLRGTPTIKPNMPIYLDGIGEDFNGYWIVLSVTHKMENFLFTTEVEVGVDSLGSSLHTEPNPKLGKNMKRSTVNYSAGRMRSGYGASDIVLTSPATPLKIDYSVAVAKVANIATTAAMSDAGTAEAINKSSIGYSTWSSTRSNVRAISG